MRICFISRRFFPAISGMSVYALNLLRELVAAGHEVVMISQYRDDAAGAAVYGGGPPPPMAGVEVVGLPALGEQQVNQDKPADFEADIEAMVATALTHHQQRPFDLVHAQYGYPNGLAALEVSRQTGLPNVVSIQGGDGHWIGTCCQTHKAAIQAVLNHSNALLIGSRSFAEEVNGHHGTPLERFTIIPGATDTGRFYPRPDRPLGALGEPPTLLYHGRVDLRKGLAELLTAVSQLVQRGVSLRLLLSGIGPDVETAAEFVKELELDQHVTLTGYADYAQAPMIYRRGDIFVSPTYSEGFSNTILEAMASGLPVISTATVGVVDCLRHEENGLLVPVGESTPLSIAIARLLEDEPLRQRLATQALAEVERLYSWRAVGSQIQEVYRQVRDAAPDNAWTASYDPGTTVAEADLSCRFRTAPHLL